MAGSEEIPIPVFGRGLVIDSHDDLFVIEENAEWLGVTRLLMMENAAQAVVHGVEEVLGQDLRGKRIAVFCGKGNNGGDGIAASRRLAARGAKVTVILIGEPTAREARYNYDLLKKCISVEIRHFPADLPWDRPDAVVDALLGTGIRGAPRGTVAEAIEVVNKFAAMGVPVVAVDVPSGLNPITGEAPGAVVRASLTVTFHGMKPGLKPEFCGKIIVAEVGAPSEALLFCGPGDVKVILKQRRPEWSHKGDFGRILIVGGSSTYTGAPALAAMSALKAGVDLAIVVAPKWAARTMKPISPNLIVSPLKSEEHLAPDDVSRVLEEVKRADAVLVGPGLGAHTETLDAVRSLLSELAKMGKPTVVDADALKAVDPDLGWPYLVITPHAGEFKAVFGVKPGEDLRARVSSCLNAAESFSGTILLKGHVDVVCGAGKLRLNVTGNPAMTVGGTGDVLSGVTTAFLAMSKDPVRSASAAAFLVGLAGDLAFEDLSYSLTASDVMEYLPRALKKIGY